MRNSRNSLRTLFSFGAVILAFTHVTPVYALPVTENPAPVELQEIKNWEAAGARWAIGKDSTGSPLAIYDLSFPGINGPILLATIDPKEFSLKKMVEMLKSRTDGSPEQLKLIQAVAALEPSGLEDKTRSLFEYGWWKKIPWKNKPVHDDSVPPQSFRLSDIDYEKILKPKLKEKFRRTLVYIETFTDSPENGPILGKDFLSHFVFVRSENGAYNLIFDPFEPTEEERLRLLMPRKIADLRSLRKGLYMTLERSIFSSAISTAIGFIPVPLVSGLLGLAVSLYTSYREDLLHLHEQLLIEQLAEAEEGSGLPMSSLSPENRSRAAQYLLMAGTSAAFFWTWIFKNPEKVWRDQNTSELRQANKTLNQLTAQGNTFQLLGDRFGVATDRAGKKKLYILPKSYLPGGLFPHVALDYQMPNLLFAERFTIETIRVLVDLGGRFVPYVGGFASSAFSTVVRLPIDANRMWESRLISHLEQRADSGEDWWTELEFLERQRNNPMDLNQSLMRELVKLRKKHLGIGAAF